MVECFGTDINMMWLIQKNQMYKNLIGQTKFDNAEQQAIFKGQYNYVKRT